MIKFRQIGMSTAAAMMCVALMVTGCNTKADETEPTETSEIEETEETTEATTTTTEATTTETTMDELFEQYLRFQDNPSVEECPYGNTVEEVTDEGLRELADKYIEEGFEFEGTAEAFWYNGAGYAYMIDNRPAFLINGFMVVNSSGNNQVNQYCFRATEELCEKYLGYSRIAVDGDIITYKDEKDDFMETKITFDKSQGILYITDIFYNVGRGIG